MFNPADMQISGQSDMTNALNGVIYNSELVVRKNSLSFMISTPNMYH